MELRVGYKKLIFVYSVLRSEYMELRFRYKKLKSGYRAEIWMQEVKI